MRALLIAVRSYFFARGFPPLSRASLNQPRIKLTHHSPLVFTLQYAQEKAGQESGGRTEQGIRKRGEDTADAECDAAGSGRGSQGGRSAALAAELVGCVGNLRRASWMLTQRYSAASHAGYEIWGMQKQDCRCTFWYHRLSRDLSNLLQWARDLIDEHCSIADTGIAFITGERIAEYFLYMLAFMFSSTAMHQSRVNISDI